jgi:hypothetical protein
MRALIVVAATLTLFVVTQAEAQTRTTCTTGPGGRIECTTSPSGPTVRCSGAPTVGCQ